MLTINRRNHPDICEGCTALFVMQQPSYYFSHTFRNSIPKCLWQCCYLSDILGIHEPSEEHSPAFTVVLPQLKCKRSASPVGRARDLGSRSPSGATRPISVRLCIVIFWRFCLWKTRILTSLLCRTYERCCRCCLLGGEPARTVGATEEGNP